MPPKLIAPDGQPIQQQITVTSDQAMLVTGMLLNAMLSTLMNTFKIPPPVIAEQMMRTVAGLISPAEPPQARQVLLDKLILQLRGDVARQAGMRAVDAAVASHVVTGKPQ